MALDERKRKEIEHSDNRRSIVRAYEYFSDGSHDRLQDKCLDAESDYEKNFSNMKFYSITRSSFAYRDALVLDRLRDAVALDYCCGNGEVAVEMATHGASRVFGIDISSVAKENADGLAKSAGVDGRCEFTVMDAEDTKFADGTFDLIHEYGALHHLDLGAAYRELSRILKADGMVVCTEALRHNPFIHWYRRRTPHLRTKWEFEHILGVPEIMQGLRHFEEVKVRFWHLAVLGAVPFRKTRFFNTLLAFLEQVDNVILKIPWIQRMAWVAVFVLKGPRKAAH